ncbi:MAG TPA: cytochrome P450 [Solirubrobacteraceae bacterium]|jgi:cytochrome P450|nr:cytochrome P450 [Solirubrobacteraceae bacterium]
MEKATSTARTTVNSPNDVDLLESSQLKCPWPSYEVLREQAPVWEDPRTGHFIVSRFEDIRTVLLNPDIFVANLSEGDDSERPEVRALYEEKGMLPATSMLGLNDPHHKQVRSLMDTAFRPKRVTEFEPYIEELCQRLLDRFIDRGEVDLSKEYAQEMPLLVMTRLMGVPEEDGHMIRRWTESWLERISMKMTPEEEILSCEEEIAAQRYFQPIIERVRANPEENLISDIVNGVVPEWGHGLSDNQIQIEILVDMFTGGTATSGHGITSAVKIWIDQPDVWEEVRSDPDKHLANFIEEVVRIDGPQQGDPRFAAVDTELSGVKIPKGTIVHPRWGAGNRDPRKFGASAAKIDLRRPQPRTHLGFGLGTHHCIGARLARRQMWYGLKTIIDNIDRMWLLDDDFEYVENYIVRGLKSLRIGFEKKQ